MQIRRALRFVAFYALVGVGIAGITTWLFPEVVALLDDRSEVVTVRETRPSDDGEQDQPQSGQRGPVSYADAVDAAAPSVVNIFTARRVQREHPLFDERTLRRFFGNPSGEETQTNLGSGVILGDQGHVLTSNHVVEGADAVQVSLNDGRAAPAEVIGRDPETDLAVLQIDLEDLPALTLGNADDLRVGDVVLAIGNPYGVGQTVTQGIVSATGRSRLGLTTFEDFIQTDAAINPGNSGGALVNAHGELIGINTAIFSRSGGSQGIGFAIPADLARDVMEALVEDGRVIRGWAGLEIRDVTPALARRHDLEPRRGALVVGVMNDGPAAEAGLQPGDLVLSVAGERIDSSRELLTRIASREPGSRVTVSGERDGERFQRQLTVSERPSASELQQQRQ